MKNIRHISEFINESYFDLHPSIYPEVINDVKFNKLLKNKSENFSESELDILKRKYSITKEIKHNRRNVRVINWIQGYDNIVIIRTSYFYWNISIRIYKLSDDWYLIKKPDKSSKPPGAPDIISENYMCDQWDGLISFLDEYFEKALSGYTIQFMLNLDSKNWTRFDVYGRPPGYGS